MIPGECESESVSKTLEFAYNDWCALRFGASGANSPGTWLNYFDTETHLMRPRYQGGWLTPFDPTMVTNHFTEANAWQYSFFVPHDINGLIRQHGGKEPFIAKLDELFTHSSATTGREQSDISGMIGQYAQGNEPSHHVAYLYNYAGAPWKTQAIVRKIMDSLFFNRPDGICGNDDCGQMSAWYVMSAMGLYQVCPGKPEYAIGTPLFPRATIQLENSKSFVIEADKPTAKRKYIATTRLNGQSYPKSWITHLDLDTGGALALTMGTLPNTEWGKSGKYRPDTSGIKVNFVAVPLIDSLPTVFNDPIVVRLSCPTPGATIYYTVERSDQLPLSMVDGVVTCDVPDTVSTAFHQERMLYGKEPIILKDRWNRISAMARKEFNVGGGWSSNDQYTFLVEEHDSRMLTRQFFRHTPIGRLALRTRYQPQYTGGGDQALVDGLRGPTDFHLGAWQGYERDDLDAVLDLGAVKTVSEAGLGCLQDNNAWIFYPTSVSFSFSIDGKRFTGEKVISNAIPPEKEGALLQTLTASGLDARARYIRVHAKNLAVCPPWHKGAGGKAWIFADEILVTAK
ncbi:MAG: GH92 family glycosyl hydrolase [Ignavibacteria bacterium]|nr:GH92 family glycosyl hydrolase [Ignavibacteria bacterium]